METVASFELAWSFSQLSHLNWLGHSKKFGWQIELDWSFEATGLTNWNGWSFEVFFGSFQLVWEFEAIGSTELVWSFAVVVLFEPVWSFEAIGSIYRFALVHPTGLDNWGSWGILTSLVILVILASQLILPIWIIGSTLVILESQYQWTSLIIWDIVIVWGSWVMTVVSLVIWHSPISWYNLWFKFGENNL